MKTLNLVPLAALFSAATAALALQGCGEADTKPSAGGPHFTESINAQTFFKGNIHTHSSASDGDAPPATVIGWYKKHGYNFLALTEHDRLVVDHSQDGPEFLTIPGVELTGEAAAGDRKAIPVHVNAICGKSELKGVKAGKGVAETANMMVKASHDDGAVTLLNHPNYEWAMTSDDLQGIDGFELLEIASGHELIHDVGDESHASEEELWDSYMTSKHRVFGCGSDDAHNYKSFGEEVAANPGRVWLQLWAPALDEKSVCEALRWGHFYISRGTKISALVVSQRTFDIQVDNWQPSTDHVDFIGAGGRLLDRVFEMPARYVLKSGEGYVRAHVFQGSSSKGTPLRHAWTQAYFIKQ